MDVKKSELRDLANAWEMDARAAGSRARGLENVVAQLQREVDDMRRNWRPIPIAHPYEPRNPMCRLCDDPAGHERHRNVAPSDAAE